MSVYGRLRPKIHDDNTDRIGIRNLVLAQMWQASRQDMTIDELDGEAPTAPDAPTGMEFIGRNRRMMNGGLKEFWTYTGVHGDPKDVPFKGYGASPDYQFDPGFSQVSILKLKGIQTLMDQYGGQVLDAEIVWPPLIDANSTNAGDVVNVFNDQTTTAGVIGLGGNGATGSKPNPMFGETEYFRTEGTYTYRYAAANLNGLNVGARIVPASGMPGYAPSYGGRDYLVGPQTFRRHGPVYAITLIGWLSGDGGWNKLIYGRASS